MNHPWHRVHDFFNGWGMKECIPDNEIVLEEHKDWGIPTRFVKHKVQEKYLWVRDTERWLQITDIWSLTSEELYEIYDRLQPFKEKHLEWLRNQPKPEFKKLTIPLVNRVYPKL